MNTIIYIFTFIIGILCGSFLTLAVYRIPLKQDILYTHSYCPNCNHKLGFIDLIPLLSYILLGGKCRYCRKKIRIRYLIYEILTGTLFVVIAFSLKIDFYTLSINKLIYCIFMFLFVIGVLLIAGIVKETKKISKPVVIYELVLLLIYMIYLCVIENNNIYKYIILSFCLTIIITVLQRIIIDLINKFKKDKIIISNVFICCYTNIIILIIMNFYSMWVMK